MGSLDQMKDYLNFDRFCIWLYIVKLANVMPFKILVNGENSGFVGLVGSLLLIYSNVNWNGGNCLNIVGNDFAVKKKDGRKNTGF